MNDSLWPDPRYRELTPELLQAISADDIGSAVVQHVELQTALREQLGAVLATLPAGTRAIYLTWIVDAEVNDGGFNQFFFNQHGVFAGEALAAYELLGAEDYATVMRAAIATYESERDQLARYHDARALEGPGESDHTGLDEADQRYYALGDRINAIWATAVHDRPELFRSTA